MLSRCQVEAGFPSESTADTTKPLIDSWPCSAPEAVRRLTSVGLADPYTWARTRDELSDGQRARFDLVVKFFGTSKLVLADGFGEPLDTLTARALAWTAGRLARRLSLTLLVATVRDDLDADLQPDILITKGWEPTPHVESPEWHQPRPTFEAELTYRRGTRADWNKLAHLHYAAGDPATMHSIHVLDHPAIDHPAAVAVMSYPDLHSSARNLATDDSYVMAKHPDAPHRLNREVLRLSRIVVAPELRSAGLAQRLIREVVANTAAKYIECSTAMSRFTSFLPASGFREIPQGAGDAEAALFDWATQSQVPAQVQLDARLLTEWADALSVRKQREARRVVWLYYHHFVLHRRTRSPVPKRIASPGDPHWPEAWAVAARRLLERPAYWMLGPIERPAHPTAAEPPNAA